MADGYEIETALARAVGIDLPRSYSVFLDGLVDRPRVFESDSGPILDYAGRQWRPCTRDGLREPTSYDGGTPKPRAHETAAIAEMLARNEQELGPWITEVLVEKGFSLERLARGFCVGDDCNGEPLFVDVQTGAVFAYYHDGMDVEQWSDSLENFMNGSRTWTSR